MSLDLLDELASRAARSLAGPDDDKDMDAEVLCGMVERLGASLFKQRWSPACHRALGEAASKCIQLAASRPGDSAHDLLLAVISLLLAAVRLHGGTQLSPLVRGPVADVVLRADSWDALAETDPSDDDSATALAWALLEKLDDPAIFLDFLPAVLPATDAAAAAAARWHEAARVVVPERCLTVGAARIPMPASALGDALRLFAEGGGELAAAERVGQALLAEPWRVSGRGRPCALRPSLPAGPRRTSSQTASSGA
jgi:hypothetical protein